MPTISLFFGIAVSMYAGDHPEPHFHARYQGHKAVYDLGGNRIAGDMPPRQERLIAAWAEIHAEDLAEDWRMAEGGESPVAISPLR